MAQYENNIKYMKGQSGEKKNLKFKGQKYNLISTFFSPHFHDLCHLPMLRMKNPYYKTLSPLIEKLD